ncbi:MAG: prepilin-type N-terminal cleavage/methylation domain-containing protein [Candidatus Falkowbacteria bacterium]
MKKGFTLIELLVVIVIIGILATLATVALSSARMKARDARRVSDIKQMMTALEMYYNEAGGYPTSNVTSTVAIYYGTNTYMAKIPANASPYADGTCANTLSNYIFSAIGTSDPATSYQITYCLGSQTGSIAPGYQTASPSGIMR